MRRILFYSRRVKELCRTSLSLSKNPRENVMYKRALFRVNKHSSVLSRCRLICINCCCCSETFRDEIIRFHAVGHFGRWRSFLPATVLTGRYQVALATGVIAQ